MRVESVHSRAYHTYVCFTVALWMPGSLAEIQCVRVFVQAWHVQVVAAGCGTACMAAGWRLDSAALLVHG